MNPLIQKADKLWQKLIMLAYKSQCLACKSMHAPLCGHHIYSKKSHPHLRHEPHNGVCVCYNCAANCHDWIHRHGREATLMWLRKEIPEQIAELELMLPYHAPRLGELEERVVFLQDAIAAFKQAGEMKITINTIDERRVVIGR